MSKKFDALLAASFFLGSIAAANLHGQTLDLTTLAEKTRPSVFLITTADRNGGSIAAGTGFLVSKDGYLVTNHHVIRKAASAVAKADNGATFRVEGILATDVERDLAVLKIASRDSPSLALGASLAVKAGEKVAVIGSPLGLEGSLSEGIVAANREVKEFGRMLQITAPISHGSSGSPVLVRSELLAQKSMTRAAKDRFIILCAHPNERMFEGQVEKQAPVW
jgi:S1-C subfamily serine protease